MIEYHRQLELAELCIEFDDVFGFDVYHQVPAETLYLLRDTMNTVKIGRTAEMAGKTEADAADATLMQHLEISLGAFFINNGNSAPVSVRRRYCI